MEVYKVLFFAVIICGVQSAPGPVIDKEPSGKPNATPANRPPLHEECSGLPMFLKPCRNKTGICYWSPDKIGDPGHMECRGYCGNYIPSVDNAVIVVDVNINTTTEGGVLTFECAEGYAAPPGSQLSITCMCTGDWTPVGFQCVKNCGDLEVSDYFEHGVVEEDIGDHLEDGIVLVKCDDTYGPTESNLFVQCVDGSWTPSGGECVKQCGTVSVTIDNASLLGTHDADIIDDRAVFVCDAGYVALGDMWAVCKEPGVWELESGKCLKDCGNALNVDIANVATVTVEDPTYEGSTHILKCDENFGSESGVSATCDAHGFWQVTGECIPDCSNQLDGSLGNFASNTVDDPTNHGSIHEVQCAEGFYSESAVTVTCDQGEWQICGQCQPLCDTAPTVTGASQESTGNTVGSTTTYTCTDSNTEFDTTCLETGEWSPTQECPTVCDTAPSVTGASQESTGNTVGSTTTYTCTDSNTEFSTYCLDSGVWSPTQDCPIVCDAAPTVTGASQESTGNTVGSTTMYTCTDSNTEFSTTCLGNGEWSPTQDCPIVCDAAPTVTGASHGSTGNTVGSTTTYTCTDSNTEFSTTCLGNGEWSPTQDCPIVCDAAPTVTGASQVSTGNTVGDTTMYTCTDSNTEFSTTCLGNGEWSPTQNCPIVCDTAPTVTGASQESTGNTVGDTTTYTCTDSNTEFSTTCLDTGEWSPTQDCPTECGDPPAADYTMVVLTNNGTTATYLCNDNTVSGEVDVSEWTINCNNFVWEETPAICYPIDVTCVVSPDAVYNSNNGVAYRFRDYCYYPIQASQTFSKGELACPDSATGSVMAIMEDEIEYNWFNELGAQTLGSRFWWAGLYWDGTSWLTYNDEEPPYIDPSLTDPPTDGYCAVIDNKAVTSEDNWISETCTGNSDTFKVICKIPADTLENPLP